MHPHLPVWVLVADASRARIFEVKIGSQVFELVSEFPHPASRAKDHDVGSDRPGRVSQSHAGPHPGKGSRSGTEEHSHKETEHDHFARELVTELTRGLNEHRCGRIVVDANPEFLGHLREVAGSNLAKHISESVAKDYTGLDARELAERLRDHLA